METWKTTKVLLVPKPRQDVNPGLQCQTPAAHMPTIHPDDLPVSYNTKGFLFLNTVQAEFFLQTHSYKM